MHSQHYLIRNALTDTNSTCAISRESFEGTSLHWEQERSWDESGDRERALHHPAALAGGAGWVNCFNSTGACWSLVRQAHCKL